MLTVKVTVKVPRENLTTWILLVILTTILFERLGLMIWMTNPNLDQS